MNDATEEVIQMGKIHLEGNVIPHTWYEHIVDENGKANLEAIILLSDIVYWYRPTYMRDEQTGKIIGVKKKFKGNALQKTKKALAEQFGMTERKVQDSLAFLEKLGLITREYRTIETLEGYTSSNHMFILIHPLLIEAISFQKCHTYGRILPYPQQKSTIPLVEFYQTNTYTTTETTTDIEEEIGIVEGPKVEQSSTIPTSSKIKKPQASEDGKDLAEHFYLKLSEVLGKIKKPDLYSWAIQIDDLMRIDNRSPEEVMKVIEFITQSHTDSSIGFDWTISVQCPKKLRDKFDKINAAMNPPKKSKTTDTKGFEENNRKKTIDFMKEHPREAAFMKDEHHFIKIGNDILYYDDPKFESLVNHYIQKQRR